MSKIIACYSVLDEQDLLRSSLDSIHKYVDGIVAFTGQWRSDRESNEETKQILRDYNCKIIPFKPNINEIEARLYLYSFVPDGDLIFWIDGDEIVIGNFEKGRKEILSSDKDWFEVDLFGNGRPWCLMPRLWKQSKEFKMKDYHYHFYLGNKLIWTGPGTLTEPSHTIKNFRILNCNILRSDNRRKEADAYREFMRERNWIE